MKEIENLLSYYGNRVIEHPIIKSIISSSIVVGNHLFGGFGQPLQILILLMLIDLITGISSAIVTEQSLKKCGEEYETTANIVTSRTMRNGIWKFIEYMIAVFIANVISLQFGVESVRAFAIMWLSLTELKSIHENFSEMGFDIPLTQQLFDFGDRCLKKEEKKNKKNKGGDN